MTVNRKLSDRIAERVMALDSSAYGDERERAVSMEASTFGFTAGTYLGLLTAVFFSLFGQILIPVMLLVITVLPSAAAIWYARRRNVNLFELAENAGSRSIMIATTICGAAMVIAFAAMAFTIFSGHPLLPTPSIEVTPGVGFFGGMAQGAVIGGILGGLAGIVSGVRAFRRARQRRALRAAANVQGQGEPT